MMVLIVDENTLELGLDDAYASFNHTASIFLKDQGLSSRYLNRCLYGNCELKNILLSTDLFDVYSGPASKLIVKFVLAVSCGFVGSLFTFPGLRVSKMHWDTLK